MGFLGFVVQAIVAVFLISAGYDFQESSPETKMALIFLCPLLFMVGTAIKRNARTGGRPMGFFGMIKAVVGSYITFVIVSAVFFGIGMGLYWILVLRPEEGIGRYD